jgi:hypothetical protein
VTKRTLSRSAKAIPKTDEKRDSNGTPPTDPDSETISVRPEISTGWTLQLGNGAVQHVRVKGGRGRISYGGARAHGEVRIYRNESTKVFDAVFTDVAHVVSDRVEVIPARSGKSALGGTIEPRFSTEDSWKSQTRDQIKDLKAKAELKQPQPEPLNPEQLFEKNQEAF